MVEVKEVEVQVEGVQESEVTVRVMEAVGSSQHPHSSPHAWSQDDSMLGHLAGCDICDPPLIWLAGRVPILPSLLPVCPS